MELSPDVFWSLTMREFWIKQAAFVRKEDRAKALTHRLAYLIGRFPKKEDFEREKKNEGALRRYALKPWLIRHGKSHRSD